MDFVFRPPQPKVEQDRTGPTYLAPPRQSLSLYLIQSVSGRLTDNANTAGIDLKVHMNPNFRRP